MTHFVKLRAEIREGTTIDEAARDICYLARQHYCLVMANFNGVELRAEPASEPYLVVQNYSKERAIWHD